MLRNSESNFLMTWLIFMIIIFCLYVIIMLAFCYFVFKSTCTLKTDFVPDWQNMLANYGFICLNYTNNRVDEKENRKIILKYKLSHACNAFI